MNEPLEELAALLLEHEDGNLDAGGTARIRELLRTSETARTFFLEQQTLSAALRLESAAGLPAHATPGPAAQRNSAFPLPGARWWLAVAVGLLIGAVGGRLLYLANAPDIAGLPPKSKEATSRGVALVTRLVDVTWQGDGFEVGDALMPGRVAISAGYAQVEFFCGATVILEGPAELELKSQTLARVHHGKLRAQVPPAARGFSLEVADMKVVDLGTEFGLAVSDGSADVQVFDGEVEVHDPNQRAQRLTAGQAVKRNQSGSLVPAELTPHQFLDIARLEARAEDQRSRRFAAWRDWSTAIRNDTRLIAYYAFDQGGGWKRRLQSSVVPARPELDGAIVGASQAAGRWPGHKRALVFRRPGDRVRVEIPGEYASLTFSCWVKIDSLDRWYNSLFLTDGYHQGEPHWQILDTGQLFFSVRVSARDGGPEHREVLSPPFWNPSLSGKWIHLATTYNVDRQRVTHFLNGKAIHEEHIPDHQLVRTTRFGRATLGNWSSPQRPDEDFAIRNLNGSMDEFALYSAALSPREVQEIYEHGKP